MTFLVIMLNVFALAGFVVLWLSISFIAFNIYISNNFESAISLARIANIIRFMLIIWFVILGIAFTTADNLVPLVLYIVLFVGIYAYVYRLYGDVLKAISTIRKDTGSGKEHNLIFNSVVKIGPLKNTKRSYKGFSKFKKFFFVLDGLICIGTLVNFWIMDTGGSSTLEAIVGSLLLIVFLQIIFLPIYYLIKFIVFRTLRAST